ncbi:MAG TPA: 2-C-methyl-D-erythritol 4-phosphate cytidylyltransferase [Steroidobacteraceae bacterium]|nr:2-C-methyl-D-erythritol 4-phosphate cytidylyltransferase [Steroidobacteraceae bacterium]
MGKETTSRFWLVMPAAGSSRRMGVSEKPKQYRELAGRHVIDWALAPFVSHPRCRGVVVALSPGDVFWGETEYAVSSLVRVAPGGAERADSVLSGLEELESRAQPEDWVLVHDAARPCFSRHDLDGLLGELEHDEVGGLLAAPIVDTLKRADAEQRVYETVPRTALWRALTPQMFRYELLRTALRHAVDSKVAVTDEAQAVELQGYRPKLVAGDADNIKITTPADLERALRILSSRTK